MPFRSNKTAGSYFAPFATTRSLSSAVFLDDLSVLPRLVLSTVKLVSSATLSLRVRRSSDNAEQDIGFVGRELDTASLLAHVGAGSGFVTKFYDQTGNGEHYEQTTAANQPRIVNAGVYDSTGLVFDGSNDRLRRASLTLGTAFLHHYQRSTYTTTGSEAFDFFSCETAFNTPAGGYDIYSQSGSYRMLCLTGAGTLNYRIRDGGSASGNHLRVCLMDRSVVGVSEIRGYRDGVEITYTDTVANEQTGTFTSGIGSSIGCRGDGATNPANMQLQTVVVYNADTSAIRTSIEALL